jgi:hypothetical protein
VFFVTKVHVHKLQSQIHILYDTYICTLIHAQYIYLLNQFVFSEDDQYHTMFSHFTAVGRGRRPDLPTIGTVVRKDLLLQLYFMKRATTRSWKHIEDFMEKNLKFPVPRSKYRTLIDNVILGGKKHQDDANKRHAFLNETVELDFVSDSLLNIGLGRQTLFNVTTIKDDLVSNAVITNNVVVDLDKWRRRDTLVTWPLIYMWLRILLPDMTLRDAALKKKVLATWNDYEKKRKQSSKPLAYSDFMKQPFVKATPTSDLLDSATLDSAPSDSPTDSAPSDSPTLDSAPSDSPTDSAHSDSPPLDSAPSDSPTVNSADSSPSTSGPSTKMSAQNYASLHMQLKTLGGKNVQLDCFINIMKYKTFLQMQHLLNSKREMRRWKSWSNTSQV